MRARTFLFLAALTLPGGFAACSSSSTAGADAGAGTPAAEAGPPDAAPDAAPPPDAGTDSSSPDAPPDAARDVTADAAREGGLGAGPYVIAYAGTTIGIDNREVSAATFSGDKLTAYTASVNESPEVGTNQVLDVGGDDAVLLGRWAGGTTAGKYFAAPPFIFGLTGGLHYAIGLPTARADVPSSGVTTYTQLAATTATRADGTKATGTASAQLVASLAGAATLVGLSVQLDIPGDGSLTVSSEGGLADPASSQVALAPTSSFFRNAGAGPSLTVSGTAAVCATRCVASVAGFFAGSGASRAGLVVHVYPGGGGAPESISAAFAFKR